MPWTRTRILCSALTLTFASGCIEREGRPVNPCTQVTVAQSIEVNNIDKVDLLFMIDNSNSMELEQESLVDELPNMVRILTSGKYDPNQEEEDFTPVRDLNVGIITTDMGIGGVQGVPTCGREFGDDGVLRTAGRTDMEGCMATYPPFMNFKPGGPQTPEDFAADVACVAVAGTGGCGYEQQLEAILKAVSPASPQVWTATPFYPIGTPDAPDGLAVPFFRNTTGHGDGANAGFLRTDSVLAIIPVTDEEDCSAKDLDLFNPDSGAYGGTDANLRCFTYPQALHPISRYVRGFLQTRVRPDLLIYAPITGIPLDLVPEPGEDPDYEALISPDLSIRDDRMEERIDPTSRNTLVPSCHSESGDDGEAYPPIRLVQTAQALQAAGAGVTVQSICQSDYSGALREIIDKIARALGDACLPRPLNVDADGDVSCDVVALMPGEMPCSTIPGAVAKEDENGQPILEQGRALCVLPPLVPSAEDLENRSPPDGTGWYYDDYTSNSEMSCTRDGSYQRIAFAGTPPPSGAQVRLECFLSVQGDGTQNVQVGTFCDPADDTLCARASPQPLSCDPITRTCGVTCETDSDCRAAGLVGYECDVRPLSALDDDFAGDSTPHHFCINPTCE